MKIMYIAPRFHTNQSAVVKGWIERGDEVLFISYYTAIIEDYSCITPVVLGFSPIYKLIDKVYVDVIHRKELSAITFKIKHGFPPVFKLKKIIKKWKPDVIIMRDKTLYSIASYLLGRKSKCILYNQNPLWENEPKKDLGHKIVNKLTPKYRMTPVLGKKETGKMINHYSYYIPLIVEPQCPPDKKRYFKDNKVHILCIGKFEPRKNHMMLMEAIDKIRRETGEQFELIIIGEATNRYQKQFLEEVKQFIKKYHYENFVTIQINVPRNITNKYYNETDVFVIPSTKEMASVSQLEAMSFSIPVVCSDTNGTSCYVKNGETGYIFKDCDKEDLKEKLEMLLADRKRIVQMGKVAYESVLNSYTFKNYYKGIQKILDDMDNEKR
ncbi:hypothetical protein C819_03032 [Lachnospiraceae bacterium 10-1]|nr:hypothetical protein C819_03032 [Lachnospiraceae bacterium 10-1]